MMDVFTLSWASGAFWVAVGFWSFYVIGNLSLEGFSFVQELVVLFFRAAVVAVLVGIPAFIVWLVVFYGVFGRFV